MLDGDSVAIRVDRRRDIEYVEDQGCVNEQRCFREVSPRADPIAAFVSLRHSTTA